MCKKDEETPEGADEQVVEEHVSDPGAEYCERDEISLE